MKTPPVNIRLVGSVTPPKDLAGVAKEALGERFPEFIEKYGEDFTPREFIKFKEEL